MATVTPKPAKRSKVSSRPTRVQANFAFSILFLVNLLNYPVRYVLSAVLPNIKHDFHLTDFAGGLLISSFLIVYAVGALPLGIWADRGVRKNIIALCVGTWSVATVGAGFAQNIVQLF